MTAGAVGLTGGCQCGALRYRLDAEPSGSICHCRMCQKASGGPFMAFGGVPNSSFVVIRGVLSTFRSSDIAERGFCAACGTPLTYRLVGGRSVGVTLGSLDAPNRVALRNSSASNLASRGLRPPWSPRKPRCQIG